MELIPIVRWYLGLKARNLRGGVVLQSKSGSGIISNWSGIESLPSDGSRFELCVCETKILLTKLESNLSPRFEEKMSE